MRPARPATPGARRECGLRRRDWTGFGGAAATAAAALAGLLFIAVSINLQRILEYPTARAGWRWGWLVNVWVLLVEILR
jgi:hypothetical protein